MNYRKDLEGNSQARFQEHPSTIAKPDCSSLEDDSKPQTIKEEKLEKPEEIKEEEKMEIEPPTSASTEIKGKTKQCYQASICLCFFNVLMSLVL